VPQVVFRSALFVIIGSSLAPERIHGLGVAPTGPRGLRSNRNADFPGSNPRLQSAHAAQIAVSGQLRGLRGRGINLSFVRVADDPPETPRPQPEPTRTGRVSTSMR
jgi:hypothetical protein